MANWNVQQVTNWGCAYFAASSATNPVKATGGAASNTSFNAAQAQAIDTKDQFTGAYSDVSSKILSLSVTGQTLRAVVQFKSTGDTARTCKSVALLSDNNVIAILSSNDVIFTIPASSTSVVGVSVDFNIVFTNTGQATVDVSTANTAMQSDLDRLVSCHVAGDAQTGEDQIVRGKKTFKDQATFDTKVIATQGVSAQGVSRFPRIISNYIESRNAQDVAVFNIIVNENGALIASKVPISINGEANEVRIASSAGILIDGRLLPVQESSYLGDTDHVWHYAHINELTAEQVSATTYLKAATQIKATTTYGIYLTDSSGSILSNVYPTDLSKIVANSAYELVGDDRRVKSGEICYLDLTRGMNDVKNVSFTIPRGMIVGNGVEFYDSASSNTFNLRVLRQGNEVLLSNTARFVILAKAVMPAVGASQTADNVRTTVLAACVNGD